MTETEGIQGAEDKHYQLDRSRMIDLVAEFPTHLREALEVARSLDYEPPRNVEQLVVCGMGGSAIGADLARSILGDDLERPLLVNRNYSLPRHVGEHSLVVLSSYSGNTEETLEAFDEARNRGAMTIALTTGGELSRRAENNDVPWLKIPRGGLPPRAALAYSFVPLLGILAAADAAPSLLDDIEAAIAHIAEFASLHAMEVPQAENRAKQLANKLYGKLPVIYTGGSATEAVGLRWKGQFNENSKSPAYHNVFPELNHNEIVGWENKGKILRDIFVLALRDPSDHPRVARRMDVTREQIKSVSGGYAEFEGSGEGRLSRILTLVSLGDFTSVYLAVQNGVDPTPVESIDRLKAQLAEG